MKSGATDFLCKPVTHEQICASPLERALEHARDGSQYRPAHRRACQPRALSSAAIRR